MFPKAMGFWVCILMHSTESSCEAAAKIVRLWNKSWSFMFSFIKSSLSFFAHLMFFIWLLIYLTADSTLTALFTDRMLSLRTFSKPHTRPAWGPNDIFELYLFPQAWLEILSWLPKGMGTFNEKWCFVQQPLIQRGEGLYKLEASWAEKSL